MPTFLHSVRSGSRRAFTLVELLVVIAIIGILVALLLPAVQSAREAGRRSSCLNNIKQLALAVHNYQDANAALPPASIPLTGTEGRPCSWIFRILPFMEQGGAVSGCTYDNTDFSMRGTDRNWQITGTLRVATLECPSNPLPHTYNQTMSAGSKTLGAPATMKVQISDYVGVNGDYNRDNSIWNGHHGMSDYNGVITAIDSRNPRVARIDKVLDGTSNTLMLGEQSNWTFVIDTTTGARSKFDQRASNWNGGAWSGGGGGLDATGPEAYWMNLSSSRVGINYVTTQGRYTPHGIGPYWYGRPGHHTIFTSTHPGGAQFARADGSARFISQNLNFDMFGRLTNAADGNPISDY